MARRRYRRGDRPCGGRLPMEVPLMALTLTAAEAKAMGYVRVGNELVREKGLGDASPKSAPVPAVAPAHRSPYKSKAESAYAGRLYVLQRAGEIREWSYEAVRLR